MYALHPFTESESHRAYPGCCALSKVLEGVMLEQYFIRYDLNGCCLRASSIYYPGWPFSPPANLTPSSLR